MNSYLRTYVRENSKIGKIFLFRLESSTLNSYLSKLG